MKTYIPEYKGWPIEAAKDADGNWGVAVSTGPWTGHYATAAQALRAGKAEVDELERRAFERRVQNALRVVGLCTPGDWKWSCDGELSIIVRHSRKPEGMRIVEDAMDVLCANLLRSDPEPDDEQVRGGTRITFRDS